MIQINVDQTLTPENAKRRGYILWQDYIYDPSAPEGVNIDIEKLVKTGWKLGKPALPDSEQNCGVGLYKPISK